MNIFIDNRNTTPIYDQIYAQIKAQIMSGALGEDADAVEASGDEVAEGLEALGVRGMEVVDGDHHTTIARHPPHHLDHGLEREQP